MPEVPELPMGAVYGLHPDALMAPKLLLTVPPLAGESDPLSVACQGENQGKPCGAGVGVPCTGGATHAIRFTDAEEAAGSEPTIH